MHTTQAQRLATIALEEKVIKLEGELRLLGMENRVLSGYVANLKVYEGIVNGFVAQLKGRLREVDPACELLGFGIPCMPEKPASEECEMEIQMESQGDTTGSQAGSREGSPESERQEGLVLLADLVEGLSYLPNLD